MTLMCGVTGVRRMMMMWIICKSGGMLVGFVARIGLVDLVRSLVKT